MLPGAEILMKAEDFIPSWQVPMQIQAQPQM